VSRGGGCLSSSGAADFEPHRDGPAQRDGDVGDDRPGDPPPQNPDENHDQAEDGGGLANQDEVVVPENLAPDEDSAAEGRSKLEWDREQRNLDEGQWRPIKYRLSDDGKQEQADADEPDRQHGGDAERCASEGGAGVAPSREEGDR
jgi:hypothetical protein